MSEHAQFVCLKATGYFERGKFIFLERISLSWKAWAEGVSALPVAIKGGDYAALIIVARSQGAGGWEKPPKQANDGPGEDGEHVFCL